MACNAVTCVDCVSSVLPAHSSCSLHKQLSVELGLPPSSHPGAVRPPKPVFGCELMDREKCCRQNSSPSSLTDVNGAVLMNSASDSRGRRADGHSRNCNIISDENDSPKPSVDSSAVTCSQLYVSTQLCLLYSGIYLFFCIVFVVKYVVS